MKKITFLLIAIISFTLNVNAQSDTSKIKVSEYISTGISVTNGDKFSDNNYGWIEGGIGIKNFSAGIAVGRVSLGNRINYKDSVSSLKEDARNYYWELKAYGNFPLGVLSGNVILGYGGVFNSTHNFIEYGIGISYSKKVIGYGISISNWDNVYYVSPGISVNF